MKEIRLKDVLFQIPDGFERLSEDEVRKLNMAEEGDEGAVFRNEEEHMIVSLGYKKINGFSALMLSEAEMLDHMAKQTASLMRGFAYRETERRSDGFCGRQIPGFGYTYEVSDIQMYGRSYLMKEKSDCHYLHFYFRKEGYDEGNRLVETILKNASAV